MQGIVDMENTPATLTTDVARPAGAVVVHSGKTLTITGGDWRDFAAFAGGFRAKNEAGVTSGYTLTLTNVNAGNSDSQHTGGIFGAISLSTGEVSQNHLLLDKVTAKDNTWSVIGGYAHENSGDIGDANHNSVTVKNSELLGIVVGGKTGKGFNACNNTVTIEDSTVQALNGEQYGVMGGEIGSGTGAKATDNTVNLKNAVIGGALLGGDDSYQESTNVVAGNTLNLSGANTVGDLDMSMLYEMVKKRSPAETASMTFEQFKQMVAQSPELMESLQGKVQNFATINITEAQWDKPVLTLAGTNGIMTNVDGSKAVIHAENLRFINPEAVVHGASMKLIDAQNTAKIEATLAAAETSVQEYTVNPLAGVLVNAALKGSLSLSNTSLNYTAANQATKLTFGDVEWKDKGALLDHSTTLSNISFAGADVDTTKIHFTNIESLEANKQMTLVSSFGDTVGTITGDSYTVGTTLQGKGKASLVGKDLIFTAETGVGNLDTESGVSVQEQTHNTVMGAAAGMTALSAGNESIGAAMEGLASAANSGPDGVSVYAGMGGGSSRQETGSSHMERHFSSGDEKSIAKRQPGMGRLL